MCLVGSVMEICTVGQDSSRALDPVVCLQNVWPCSRGRAG